MISKIDIKTWSSIDVLLKVKTDSFPSEDAQARIAPSSWGAQDTEFTSQAAKPNNRATRLNFT